MKKIGMVVAVEMEALLARYGEPKERQTRGGFPVLLYELHGYVLIVVNTGAGEIASAAATQLLITGYEVDLVVNYGVVGGLTEEMGLTRSCLVESVVHYDFDTSGWDGCEPGRYLNYPSPRIPATAELIERVKALHPELKTVICASGDKFVASPEKKRELHERFGADICEMEAAGIVLTCSRSGVPCLLVKTVSDGISGGAEEFDAELQRASMLCVELLDSIIREL